jgi:subtilase family serine protease
MPGDPNTGFLVGQTQQFSDGLYYDEYRIGGTSLSSPLLAGIDAVVSQRLRHPIGFANPLYYNLLGTNGVRDIVAPKAPFYQVRSNFVNTENANDGRTYQLQNIDVQTSLIHSRPGYDDETGVGTPGSRFFNLLR